MTEGSTPVETLSNLLREERRFEPSAEFAAQASLNAEAYEAAAADRLAFWSEQAHRLDWQTPFNEVLDWSQSPFAKWFVCGRLSVAYNCLDRRVAAGRGDSVAYLWEAEDGASRSISYTQLKDEVCKATNSLIELGVRSGDRVAIHIPMISETVVATLACARLGARHTVVSPGSRSTRCEAGSWIATPGSSSPPTASFGAAPRCRSSRSWTRRCRDAPMSAPCWWCAVPARTSRGPTSATCGGTTRSPGSRPSTPPRRTTPSTRSTSCRPRAPPPNPRQHHTAGGYLTQDSLSSGTSGRSPARPRSAPSCANSGFAPVCSHAVSASILIQPGQSTTSRRSGDDHRRG